MLYILLSAMSLSYLEGLINLWEGPFIIGAYILNNDIYFPGVAPPIRDISNGFDILSSNELFPKF